MGYNTLFGNEPDDETRFNSALTYWKRVEEKADLFWTDALDITKDEKLGKELLDQLFRHLNKFQMFKIDDDTNADVGYQKTRKLENIKVGVEKDEVVQDDDDQIYYEEDDQVYDEDEKKKRKTILI